MPITLKTNINLEYKKLGLPILLLDTWFDILTYTEDDLEAVYKKEFNSDDFQNILMFAYWKNKINNKKFRRLVLLLDFYCFLVLQLIKVKSLNYHFHLKCL